MEDQPISAVNAAEQIQKEIQNEHQLISHRLVWFSAFQGLLIAGYVNFVSKQDASKHLVICCFPIAGAFIAWLCSFTIQNALCVQADLIVLQCKLILRILRHSNKSLTFWQYYFASTCLCRKSGIRSHTPAMLPPILLPVAACAIWAILATMSSHWPWVIPVMAVPTFAVLGHCFISVLRLVEAHRFVERLRSKRKYRRLWRICKQAKPSLRDCGKPSAASPKVSGIDITPGSTQAID